MKFSLYIVSLFVIAGGCSSPKSLENEPDCSIRGNVIPGEAAGRSGQIHVVASRTSEWDDIDWNVNAITLSSYGAYEIEELTAGKYFVIIHLDEDRNGSVDAGEAWGGHDTNGDKRLDPVTLVGGNTVTVDVRFYAIH
ncbi:MAG: hypothetical protein V2J62_13300 [candidate division KSB1 bacterium]|jgi:hypothetical protein|nr:hypothetical protein [candidate division KSB1 bacterium]